MFIWKGSRQMTSRVSLSSMLRQFSPFSSIEILPDLDQADGQVEAVIPGRWLADYRIVAGSLVLKDSSGRERRIPLEAPVHGSPVIETFGNLTLLKLACEKTKTAAVENPTTSPARVTRHLGQRGAIGAA